MKDIYGLFETDKISFNKDDCIAFGQALGDKIANRLSEERGRPQLRMSNLGTPCRRKLWYSLNSPQLAERLSAPTRIKFLFGDILEELLLFLSRVAGHTVTDEQKEVSIDGVKGHLDGKIDGEVVDCKSASTYGYWKFHDHALAGDDSFGYLSQLNGYTAAEGVDRGHFLAIDKQLGNIVLDTWDDLNRDIKKEITDVRGILAEPQPPPRGFDDVPDGSSGNRKLGVACSYCAFKTTCWPGLKEYKYSNGPRYLTVVKREPRVDRA